MRYDTLSEEKLGAVISATWDAFTMFCRLTEEYSPDPLLVVVHADDLSLDLVHADFELMPMLIEKYGRPSARCVPILCSEVWMVVEEPGKPTDRHLEVRHRPGARSYVTAVAGFNDRSITIRGALSHENPVKGVKRTVRDVTSSGGPPVGGRLFGSLCR